jgi:3-hydroxyisobutyrate dehydrogenase-like beta-hydroxyacid dehydrogenase
VQQLAFAGPGRMGLPMCAALVSAGYQVTATDKRAEAEEAAMACGAIWGDTPAQAPAAAGVLITMLPGPREVQAAMLGEVGALKSWRRRDLDRHDQQLPGRRPAHPRAGHRAGGGGP